MKLLHCQTVSGHVRTVPGNMHVAFEIHTLTIFVLSVGDVMAMLWRHATVHRQNRVNA